LSNKIELFILKRAGEVTVSAVRERRGSLGQGAMLIKLIRSLRSQFAQLVRHVGFVALSDVL
jgi:hypothetical protein